MRENRYKSSLPKVWSYSLELAWFFHISMTLKGWRKVASRGIQCLMHAASIMHGSFWGADESTHWHNCLPCGSLLNWMLASSQSFLSFFLSSVLSFFVSLLLKICWFIELTFQKKKVYLAFMQWFAVLPRANAFWHQSCADVLNITPNEKAHFSQAHPGSPIIYQGTGTGCNQVRICLSTPCALVTWKERTHN